MSVKTYLSNLWRALTGRELLARDGAQQVKSLQQLTENLRQRIADKDAELEAQSRRYSDAISTMRLQHQADREKWEQRNQDLSDDLDATLDQLQRVNNDIGREMVNTNLLNKINSALGDLRQAMISENIEKMKEVVEYLSSEPILAHIAQLHLNVLMRESDEKGISKKP